MSKHFTRAQVGQALECAYIQSSELEEVIDNVLVMLREAWDEGAEAEAEASCMIPRCGDCVGCTAYPLNPYKEN